MNGYQVELGRAPIRTGKTYDIAQLWRYAYDNVDGWMDRVWAEMVIEWLDLKESLCGSPHTRRSYQQAIRAWLAFLQTQIGEDGREIKPWQVEVQHVRAWKNQLSCRLSPVTVNHHLACVSSFYSFVSNERRMIGGVEFCLFADATGKERMNPFRYGNIQRTKVDNYERVTPLADENISKLLHHLKIHSNTITGARNYALIMSYLSTGFRNHEVTRMQWRHIRSHRNLAGVYIYAWRGKRGKTDEVQIPQRMWDAIVNMLMRDGRWVTGVPMEQQKIAPDDYLWRPLRTHMIRNLTWNHGEWKGNGPLSDKSALRILRSALKNAGVPSYATYRVHDLRHTQAIMMLEDGATETEVMLKLHHSSLATTGHYTKSIRKRRVDRIDDRSDRMIDKILEM